MSEEVPDLQRILKQFDDQLRPTDDLEIYQELEKLRKHEMDSGLVFPADSVAECAAFMFHPDSRRDDQGTDPYYGPMFSGVADNGDRIDTPNIRQFDESTLAYWERRARAAVHPMLKVRYADLCWDFQKTVTGDRPSIDMARIVIDSTVEATSRRLLTADVSGRKKLERALSIAISLKDEKRIELVRDEIVAYEDAVARDDKCGLWGFSFDLVLENKKVPKPTELELKIIGDLEDRLTRLCSDVDGKPVDAWGAEEASFRLAKYYRRMNRIPEVQRVLMLYGEAFRKASHDATGMQAAAWMRKVYDRYREFELMDAADAILPLVREYSQKMEDELGVIETSFKVPKKDMDEFLATFLAGTLSDGLNLLATELTPKKQQVVTQVEKMRNSVMSIIPFTMLDGDGRPAARIGGTDEDPEGRIVYWMSQNLRFAQMFLYLAIDHIRETFHATADDLANHLQQSPAFPEESIPLIRAGIDAYLRGDMICAAHVLTPQIEAAIRHLLELRQGSTWKPHRSGGMMLKNMDDFLREETLIQLLGEDRILYLRTLLTDQRGWNLRNAICHGLLTAESFSRTATDRLLHVLLILALVRSDKNDSLG